MVKVAGPTLTCAAIAMPGREPTEHTRRQRGVLRNCSLVTLVAVVLLTGCASEPGSSPTTTASATTNPPSSVSPSGSSSTPPTSPDEADPGTLIGKVELVGVSLDGNSIVVRPMPSAQSCAAEQTVKDVILTEDDDPVSRGGPLRFNHASYEQIMTRCTRYFTPVVANFFACQFRNGCRSEQSRRWTDNDFLFAFTIYAQSPQCYLHLSKLFSLPPMER